jgi:hypothetical protein
MLYPRVRGRRLLKGESTVVFPLEFTDDVGEQVYAFVIFKPSPAYPGPVFRRSVIVFDTTMFGLSVQVSYRS